MELSQKLNASAQHLPTILDGTQVVPVASIHVFHQILNTTQAGKYQSHKQQDL